MVGKNTLTSTIENDTYFKISHEIKMLTTKKSKVCLISFKNTNPMENNNAASKIIFEEELSSFKKPFTISIS